MGYYYFCLTGAVKTALLEGLNCKSLIVRQSVLMAYISELNSSSGVHYNLVLKLLKPGREKQSPGSTLDLKEKNQDYFLGLTENLLIKFKLLRAPPPYLKGEDGPRCW